MYLYADQPYRDDLVESHGILHSNDFEREWSIIRKRSEGGVIQVEFDDMGTILCHGSWRHCVDEAMGASDDDDAFGVYVVRAVEDHWEHPAMAGGVLMIGHSGKYYSQGIEDRIDELGVDGALDSMPGR